MRGSWRRALAARLLAVLGWERGALLWIPALLLATSILLFGIHQAPLGSSLFTRTTSIRIVVGPWSGPPGSEPQRAALLFALRRGLRRHGDLSLVDSLRVAQRLGGAGGSAASLDAGHFLNAIRPLNPHIGLRGRLLLPDGRLLARLEAWDAHARRRLLVVEVEGDAPGPVGEALAESVQAAVLRPHRRPNEAR